MNNQSSKPRILLTGKTGQVGRELAPLLGLMGEVTALDRRQLDLAKPDEIRRVMRAVLPEVIVNAAAYTAVDGAESDEALARALNAVAPGIMAEEAKRLGALLVHYSTDYIFDGTKQAPYEEDDPPNPLNAYGRTKLEGERSIQQVDPAYLIFRTAWVYAPEGRNFMRTVLRLATEKAELRIVQDQMGAPTSSASIAAATAKVLSAICSGGNNGPVWSQISGIYHMTAGGETTWYEFAQRILELASGQPAAPGWFAEATNNRPLIARRVIPIRTSEFPTAARRPAYSVLSNRKLNDTFGVTLPDWETQLHSIFSEDVLNARARGITAEQRPGK